MRTVHALPTNGSRVYPCCGRTSFEIPRTDGITWADEQVTCAAVTAARTHPHHTDQARREAMSETPTAENGLPERKPLGAPCRYCGSADTWVEWRLEAKPVGSFSLAGAQMKFSANRWPYAVCDGCGHASRGKPTRDIPPAKPVEAPDARA